jgi:hypothetical protein
MGNGHRLKLTDAAVRALKPAAIEYEVHDTVVDGFRLRVGRGGAKSWTLFYHRDDRNRRLGLGRYPFVSLFRARQDATAALGKIKGPERGDPAEARSVQRNSETFGDLANLFLASQHFATRAESTQKELRRIIEVELRPLWGNRRLGTIERVEIQRWGDRMVGEGRKYMANRSREYMQLIWHWGLGRADLSVPSPHPFGQVGEECSSNERSSLPPRAAVFVLGPFNAGRTVQAVDGPLKAALDAEPVPLELWPDTLGLEVHGKRLGRSDWLDG